MIFEGFAIFHLGINAICYMMKNKQRNKRWGNNITPMVAEMVEDEIVPPEAWKHGSKHISCFKGAASTVLFFINLAIQESFQAKFTKYADYFPPQAQQTNAI
ncbi:Uncharacterized protein HZ326_31077 [Fusarium oxysporum f. sp. albedinis]|nr:Uncharacterized protein HZ326_31077 [Fusarium oxysporum f. sp. albedinis]